LEIGIRTISNLATTCLCYQNVRAYDWEATRSRAVRVYAYPTRCDLHGYGSRVRGTEYGATGMGTTGYTRGYS